MIPDTRDNMGADQFPIGNKMVGHGHPCFLIAEIGLAHDGSLGAAHAYIDAVGKAGVDAVKFQTHIAEAESTPAERFRVKFSYQDATRYAYWQRTAFTESQWRELAQHATSRGLAFLSTPFSLDAVEMLERIGVPAWKVGSGDVGCLPMIERMARTGKPVLLSSGMSKWSELDAAVTAIRRRGTPCAVFQCTTAYPCPPEQLGLNVMEQLRDRYHCPVGLSDHSGTIFSGLAATTLGASMIEVHVVFSRDCFGPDVPASVSIAELNQLVEGVRFIERALAHPLDKEAAVSELSELRCLFGRSIVVGRDLVQGHRLTEEDLVFKKPGIGMPPSRLVDVVGRTLRREMAAGALLSDEDLA